MQARAAQPRTCALGLFRDIGFVAVCAWLFTRGLCFAFTSSDNRVRELGRPGCSVVSPRSRRTMWEDNHAQSAGWLIVEQASTRQPAELHIFWHRMIRRQVRSTDAIPRRGKRSVEMALLASSIICGKQSSSLTHSFCEPMAALVYQLCNARNFMMSIVRANVPPAHRLSIDLLASFPSLGSRICTSETNSIPPSLCDVHRRNCVRGPHKPESTISPIPSTRTTRLPVAVIHLGLRAEQLLLPRLVRVMPAHQIAVFFCLQHGNEVDARPHLLAGQFTALVSLVGPGSTPEALQDTHFCSRIPLPTL